jgi:CRISPR system Cascade subunit CasD
MPDYLVFQMYGPMSSWGDMAVGETRRSTHHPSKSAALGMMAAAHGIDREDESTLSAMAAAYGFAVKVLSPGSLMVDYHTVQVPPQKRKEILRTRKDELAALKLGTLLSSREYRCDAAYLSAIWVAQEPAPFSLVELMGALKSPIFTLYLGRKSCPVAIPLSPEVRKFDTLKEALDSRKNFEREMAGISRSKTLFYYWDDTPHSGLKTDQKIERWDAPQSRSRWQFGPRSENLCMVEKEA